MELKENNVTLRRYNISLVIILIHPFLCFCFNILHQILCNMYLYVFKTQNCLSYKYIGNTFWHHSYKSYIDVYSVSILLCIFNVYTVFYNWYSVLSNNVLDVQIMYKTMYMMYKTLKLTLLFY